MSLMHDLDRPLEDLKEIKVSLGSKCPTTTDLIDSKIKDYESDISAAEAYFNSDDYKKYGKRATDTE